MKRINSGEGRRLRHDVNRVATELKHDGVVLTDVASVVHDVAGVHGDVRGVRSDVPGVGRNHAGVHVGVFLERAQTGRFDRI